MGEVGEAAEHGGRQDAPPEGTEAAVHVAALRAALARHERSGAPAPPDEAFAAAAAAVSVLRGPRRQEPADAEEVGRLMARLPDYERLVTAAVDAAGRSAHTAAIGLWEWFGLDSEPPEWNQAERSGARVLVACACAPLDACGVARLRRRLRALAARRWSALLTAELRSRDDALWRHVLRERYASVHRRCAPRSKWRTHELAELLRTDDAVAGAMQKRLARWMAAGGDFRSLPGELEAAFVLSRAPARLA